MSRRFAEIVTWLGDWNRFCALAVVLFLVRAAFLLSVLPPFEGWDEYQHVAYVAHWIEHGSPPMQDEAATVPRSLYPALVRFPQPKLAVDQIGSIGAMEYETFWQRRESSDAVPEVRADAPAIPLYQAQHPPLYYQVVSPMMRGRLDPDSIVAAITSVRLLGVALGAATLLLIAMALTRLVRPGPARHLMLLAVATQPLLLLNCARVASDPLAVLFGTLVVVMVLEFRIERWRRHGLILGIGLGLAVLAKAYNLLLVPFILMVWLDRLRRGQWRLSQIAASLLLIGAVAAFFTGDYIADNFRRYGALTPMQEAVINARNHIGAGQMLREALSLEWLSELTRKYLRQSLFVGGWSYIKSAGAVTWLYQACIIVAAIVGAVFTFQRRRRESLRLFTEPGSGMSLLSLGLCYAAGLVWHMLSSRLAWGSITTNVWYAAVSFPWLLCLYYQAIAYMNRRALMILLGGGLIVLHGSAETWGILGEMVPRYAGTSWGPLARERLALLTSSTPGPGMTLPAAIVAIGLTWLGLFAAFAGGNNQSRGATPR